MSPRFRSIGVIAKRQAFDALISPGFYLTLVIGLLLQYALASGFARAVDSSGFNPPLWPLYDVLSRSLEGAFGKTFVEALFAEGPLPLAFAVSFAPVFLFIAVSSVFKFGLERSAGAIELIVYGPADGTSYFVASYVKDLFLAILAIIVLLAFTVLTAAIYNYVVGPQLIRAALVAFFLALALLAYGVLASMLTANAASSLALFLGIVAFFLAVLLGSFSIVSEYVRNLSSVLAWAFSWISPFFYGALSLRAATAGNGFGFAGGLALLALLAGALLLASHFIMRVRGVRA